MTGLEVINAMPVWLLASLVIVVCVGFSVGLQLLVRWRFGVEFIVANHLFRSYTLSQRKSVV